MRNLVSLTVAVPALIALSAVMAACSSEDAAEPGAVASGGSASATSSGSSASSATQGASAMMPSASTPSPGSSTSDAASASAASSGPPAGSSGVEASASASSTSPPGVGSMPGGMGPRPMPSASASANGSAEPPDAGMSLMDAAGEPAEGETGKLMGITERHNYYRAMVDMDMPLPDLVWDPEIAALAQEWADVLAEDCGFEHSMRPGLGENLAKFGTSAPSGPDQTGADAVDMWYSEIECYSYGTFGIESRPGTQTCTSECDEYGGCGHYTQVVWRETLRVGCGVSSCTTGNTHWDTYVCNYDPPGNYLGEYPY